MQRRIIETHDRVMECLESAGLDPNQSATGEASDSPPSTSTSNEVEPMEADEAPNERESLERRYREELKPLQIRSDPDTINSKLNAERERLYSLLQLLCTIMARMWRRPRALLLCVYIPISRRSPNRCRWHWRRACLCCMTRTKST